MGKKLLAHCSRCQFQLLVFTGSGRNNLQLVNYIPALHLRTGEFTTVNLKDRKVNWDDYYFYTVAGEKGMADFCPACGGNTLTFGVIGYFD